MNTIEAIKLGMANGQIEQAHGEALIKQAHEAASRMSADAKAIGSSDYALLSRGLERRGLSPLQIHARILENGVDAYGDILETELRLEKQEQQRFAAVRAANTPEARMKAAREAEANRAEKARTAQLARVYLDENAETLGLPRDANTVLSDDEAIQIAFGEGEES